MRCLACISSVTWTLRLSCLVLALTAAARTEPATSTQSITSTETITLAPTAQTSGHDQPATSATTHESSAGHDSAQTKVSTSASPGTCAFASIDYVTRRPPSQCYTQARPTKTTATLTYALPSTSTSEEIGEASSTKNGGSNRTSHATASTLTSSQTSSWIDGEAPAPISTHTLVPPSPIDVETSHAVASEPTPGVVAVEIATVIDPELESPLDKAKFLSFEDWKKQNLPQAQENADRRKAATRDPRSRPGFDNALEGLGDDGEIVLDFSGFGGSMPPGHTVADSTRAGATQDPEATQAADKGSGTQRRRPRDAGKTCKERSNYASFDCGSSVLKTNPQGKKASSVLVENKDSYMLNECSADNKFLIVELCDEIKIDTIVLANFEFFSSIFRTFRVSVSDRYPVRIDKWKNIGTFEARNTRDLQAFLVENHDGFARYVRIEFLTHYGSEFYCPVSLFRIHGVTAFEEYKLDQLGDQDAEDEAEEAGSIAESCVPVTGSQFQAPVSSAVAVPATPSNAVSMTSTSIHPVQETESNTPRATSAGASTAAAVSEGTQQSMLETCVAPASQSIPSLRPTPSICPPDLEANSAQIPSDKATSEVHVFSVSSTTATLSRAVVPAQHEIAGSGHPHSSQPAAATSDPSPKSASSGSAPPTSTASPSSAPSSVTTSLATAANSQNGSPSRMASVSATASQHREPPSQESFFKSIHKRLQQLEANSTLSLKYIESQSALLRDAFEKVEKRQVAKTTTFLSILNATVSAELSRFQSEYEQLWQSTIMELASQRDEGRRERELLGERIRVLAEEMVSQKRLMAAQATILLLCLGLIIFARFGSMGGTIDTSLLQGMQEIVNKGKRVRAVEKGRGARSPRWRWGSPWASPTRNRSTVTLTPGHGDDRVDTGASTPRSFEESHGLGFQSTGSPHHQPYVSFDGADNDGPEPAAVSALKSSISAQTVQSAPTTPLSEMPTHTTHETNDG